MDSGQFGGADFKSDVCQIVSVEHFFLWHEIQDGRRENRTILIVSLSALYKALFAGVIK